MDRSLFWAEVDSGTENISAVVVLQDAMGKAAATRAASAMLERYEVGLLAVVGIAGGLSGDAGIGDVCFTGPLFDVLENSKVVDTKKGMKIEFNNLPYNTDPLLTFALKYVSLGSDIKSKFEDWQLDRYYKSRELIPGEFIGRQSKNEHIGIPQIHDGSIVCAAVSKSEIYKSNVTNLDRKLLAVETETGGVFSEAVRHGVPVVTVRGICDYADENKSKLEAQTGGNARRIAADNAVSFVKLQFENPQFQKFLGHRRSQVQGVNAEQAKKEAEKKLVATALDNLREEVHTQLTQLSPEYQGKPKGYRLPLPRVKVSPTNASVSPSTESYDEKNILEAVAKTKTSLVTIPRNYPDNGLPWIVAQELSLIEINGKTVVPVVIKGEDVRPPHNTLSKQAGAQVDAIEARDDARLVFIVHDFPLASRSRLEFLRTEQQKYEEAHFLVLNRTDADPSDMSALQVALGAERFDLCQISFSELSDFIKRSFQYPDQQASVVALRLQNMFRKFELNAHPSYFAGLSSESLAALLKANRRSELLQLAVGGFLSFVVAGDEDQVVLSRTTREKFLRMLAYRMEVRGEEFDRPALVSLVEEFALERDFEIDSLLFLKAFQDKGILHFSGGKVRITLPFMLSYLLAVELAAEPEEALRYFNFQSEDFDFPTFELYCEIARNEAITNKIISQLRSELEEFRQSKPNIHVLLTNDVRPVFVDHPGRFKALETQLQRAVDDVVNDRSNSHEKQRIIDIANRVQADAREIQDAVRQRADDDEKFATTRRLAKLWGIATMSLGSGSEQLARDPKRELAQLVVSASSALLDMGLRTFPAAQFENLKRELKSDSTARDLFNKSPEEPISPEDRELIELMVDAYEFSLLGLPIRAVFAQLGNFAGQAVLRTSVASVTSEDLMENLVARIWAAEISAAKEKAPLLAAIRDLPPVPFLRHSLSTYFMTRVFWDHWQTDNRLALLDAAEESLTALNSSIDKGRLRRIIKRDQERDD
ncbi:hypothetical protein CYG48_05505 [Neorhizobium sp. SOG26]|nr:hypothetical protein CYG48_05505 [Neorhizobium sp. SOG26]